MGNISGTTFIHKFGIAPDFDTDDNEVEVWDGANDAAPNLMTYTFSSTADIDRISSSEGADTEPIEIQGLDTNYDLVTQTITLTGQTAATLTTDLVRVFRMINKGSADLVGTCYCFVNVATTGGVPNTLGNIRAMITIGNGQTLMAIYTIPNGKTGFMLSFYGATEGAKRTSNYKLKLYDRPFGEVFTLEEHHALVEAGTSHFNHHYAVPTRYEAKTDLKMTAQVTAANITDASVGGGFELIIIDN